MQVRHNTTLLEQAVDHVVRRASIPLIEAEAAAQEKRYRATAFRRLATGAAIALVAVGIGLGVYLSKRVDVHKALGQTDFATSEKLQRPKGSETQEKPNDSGSQTPASTPSKTEERRQTADVTTQGKTPPSIDTFNFTIFKDRTIRLFDKQWYIQAGHNFATEADQQARNWSAAWCYTVLPVDGLDLRINLGSRPSTASAPGVPEASKEALSRAALTPFEALTLATKCPWLDGKSFDIETISGGSLVKQSHFRVDGMTLVFNGEINAGFAAEIANNSFDMLEINSPGGLIGEAVSAGRWLRSNRKIVQVKDECLSACIFVLAGGLSRQAEESAHIGVHRFFKDSAADVGDIELAQEKSAEILQFLQSMGVKNDLWYAMAKTPSATMQYIEHDKLRAWRLLSPAVIDIPDEPSSSNPNDDGEGDFGRNQEEFAGVPNSKQVQPGRILYRLTGFDAPGNDFPGMPIKEVTESECELRCSTTARCMAATYNTAHRVCFLKTGMVRANPFPSAVTYYRPELHRKFQVESGAAQKLEIR